MSRKSIPAFVFGLVGSIVLIIAGFGSLITLMGNPNPMSVIMTLLFCLVGGIIGIVGACLCFKKARIGAILMTVAVGLTALCGIMGGGVQLMILIGVVMNLIGAVFAYTAKETQTPAAPQTSENEMR